MINYNATPRDWPEDFPHDNGMYMNGCTTCKETFIGYKRRVTCKVCGGQYEAARASEFKALQEKFLRVQDEYQRVHSEFTAARTARDAMCPHSEIKTDKQYYEGGYDYTNRTEHWEYCTTCKKTLKKWTEDHGSYS